MSDKPKMKKCKVCQKELKPLGYARHLKSHNKPLKVEGNSPTSVKDVIEKKKKGRGGAMPGAGRPKGSFSQRTIERMAQKRHMVQRIVQATDKLLNAQLDKAIGEKYLMVKITERGSKGGIIRQYHEIVTNPQTIIDYLDGELDGGTTISDEDHFYYMSTKPADNMAIANMLDRAYGKPTEKVELGGADEGDLSEVSDEELNKRIDTYLEQRRKK